MVFIFGLAVVKEPADTFVKSEASTFPSGAAKGFAVVRYLTPVPI